jgi:hypothetical protein
MTVTYLGSVSVGGAVPGADIAVSAGVAGITVSLPNLEAHIAALQAFKPVSVDFVVQKQMAIDVLASVQQSITLGLPVPSIQFQIDLVLAQVDAYLALLNAINAQLKILTDLSLPLMEAGVHVYAYDGPVNQLGSQMGGALAGGVPGGSGGTQHGNAVVMLTTIPTTWAAMGEIVKVAP